jgi:transcriptional regulator with XRE-family HTH domain
MDRLRPPVSHRIAHARKHAGIASADVARKLGISHQAYDDLEANDEEAFMCVPLGLLLRLGQLLSTSPRLLLAPEGYEPLAVSMTINDVVKRIRSYVKTHSLSSEQFEIQVGWSVSEALINPESAWEEWNADGLQDICASLGIDWLSVIPDIEVKNGFPPARE